MWKKYIKERSNKFSFYQCAMVHSARIMSRRVNLIGIGTITLSFFILIFFATKNSNDYDNGNESSGPHTKIGKYKTYFLASDGQQQVTQNLSVTIDDVLNYQRNVIAEDEMKYYEFPNGKFDVEAKNLQELTLETGGNPMRSIIVTTWRSGSTFLGDVLNSMPGNYYHYEPLLNFDIIQIRGPPHEKTALENLKKLLKCNYTGMEDYLEYGQTHKYLFTHNSRLWSQCQMFPNFCFKPKFLEPFCSLFPLQSMKVVRLRMRIAANLLQDSRWDKKNQEKSLKLHRFSKTLCNRKKLSNFHAIFSLSIFHHPFSLNVRIVLLIRDPRGALQSRKHRVWCPGNPDCDNPNLLCKDMVDDYKSAVELAKKFPMTFKWVLKEFLGLFVVEVVFDRNHLLIAAIKHQQLVNIALNSAVFDEQASISFIFSLA